MSAVKSGAVRHPPPCFPFRRSSISFLTTENKVAKKRAKNNDRQRTIQRIEANENFSGKLRMETAVLMLSGRGKQKKVCSKTTTRYIRIS
jgi:hypothetical protein